MSEYYILDGHTPVKEPDLLKWGQWFETANRVVRKSKGTVLLEGKPVGEIEVSTVFLGLDHSFGEGEPLLFETMIFGGPLDEHLERCSTWEAAEQMHEKMCLLAKIAAKEPG